MRGFVANTDFDWFSFLAARQPLEEVNFWQPSGGDTFRALAPGEPFFFRLKKPHYAIAGFGLFARHEVVTAKLAWEAFGERNGAPDFADREVPARPAARSREAVQGGLRTMYVSPAEFEATFTVRKAA